MPRKKSATTGGTKGNSKKKKESALDILLGDVLKDSKRLSETGDDFVILEWLDTGSCSLNLLLSGDLYGGIPDNRTIQYVGDPSSGKSFMTKQLMKIQIERGWEFVYIDTEGDVEKPEFERAGIDTSKVAIVHLKE